VVRPAPLADAACGAAPPADAHRDIQHLHIARQEETMQYDRDRFSRAAAITAVLTLCCTIGVLYLPLFLR
jgi:hypothetical protein